MSASPRIGLITSIPWTIQGGSGCYVGTRTLLEAFAKRGIPVERISPRLHLPFPTLERIVFNEALRWRDLSGFDATIGIDFDGYAVPCNRPHVANIKGVLGDAVRFESGWAGRNLALQAALEKKHARRADLIVTISRYCADRLRELYRPSAQVCVVPELIALSEWRQRLARNSAVNANSENFIVFCVARFYARKRIGLLIEAAALLRAEIPQLRIRVAGNGPGAAALHRFAAARGVADIVHWCGDITGDDLAREYNGCHLFCLPSVQEGFGIVFLEAMAAGKPVVAVRASAVPEVVPHGCLVEPDSTEALAAGILEMFRNTVARERNAQAGRDWVGQFDAPIVAGKFLAAIQEVC